MTQVVWKDLAKDVGDLIKISEEIDADISVHNEDPSAHGQTGEAIFSHRGNATLDHINESVINAKIKYIVRGFNAVVDANLSEDTEGQYQDIQEAINYVHSLGGGKILVRTGTYYYTARDLVLYSNIDLIGEDDDNCIIDFGNSAYSCIAVGTAGTHLTNINISGLQFYRCGDTTNGALKFDYVDNSSIVGNVFESNLNAAGDNGLSIKILNSTHIKIRDNRILNGHYDIDQSNVNYFYIENNYFYSTNSISITCTSLNNAVINKNYFNAVNNAIYAEENLHNSIIDGNIIIDCESNGIGITTSTKNRIVNNYIEGTTDSLRGIDIEDCNNEIISNNHIIDFDDDGIEITTSDENIVNGNVINGNGAYGIDITNAQSDNNIVTSNIIKNNTSGSINDTGTGTISANNQT
ncbi:right-handed parallel beta-helix repeat-containing protein [bacterium]|nr:right-handed parallel beta-helix repeat-containing protein [bacterium]